MPGPTHPLVVEQARSAEAIATRLERRLVEQHIGPGTDPLRQALVHIGARYGELLVERLNAAPLLWRDCFAAGIGPGAQPAVPAQVVLSFLPVASRTPLQGRAVAPAHTMAAAAPPPGESEPVVFETLADLDLLRAEPVRAVLVDPSALRCADLGALFEPGGLQAEPAALAVPAAHALHLAVPAALVQAPGARLALALDVHDAGRRPPGSRIEWGLQGPKGFVLLPVRQDGTQQLTRSGVVELAPPAPWPLAEIDGITAPWLTCRLLPAGDPDAAPAGAPQPFSPPRIGNLRLTAVVQLDGLALEAAAFGTQPLDTSKDFFPLGERPRFGDVCLLAAPAFAMPGARVTLVLQLTNPAGRTDGPLPPVQLQGAPRIAWEIHTRRGWVALDVAEDGTQSLTRDGCVVFEVPADPAVLTVAGRSGHWVRARLAGGHYGAPQVVDGVVYPVAPSIAALELRVTATTGPLPAAQLLRTGPLQAEPVDVALNPVFDAFPRPDTDGPALYLALDSHEALLAGRSASLLAEVLPPPGRVVWRADSAAMPTDAPRWQLRADGGWQDLPTTDGTRGLSRSGLLQLKLPAEPAAWPRSALDPAGRLRWLRIAWPASARLPGLRRLALNSVAARQSLRLDDEILGSGTGKPGQVFQALRTPIVGPVVLQVREPGDALRWERWHEVRDFSASDSGACHFTIDRGTGQVRFGDGRQGRIPPPGPNNVRLHEYHAGGGQRGNLPPGSVNRLRSAVPYVQGVTHWLPATGGQDGCGREALAQPAGAWLRHRDRAICADDYADLARAASPEVARAFCLPCRDAASAAGMAVQAGWVSVVVVPHGDEDRPQPALELLGQVQAYLDARRPLAGRLVVAGPVYAGVSVRVQLRCDAGRSPHETAAACERQLRRYLHPVLGGPEGRGWTPGARPHASDLVALAGAIDGVAHVESLKLRIDEPATGEARDAIACPQALQVGAVADVEGVT